jgi:hypothetical protein
MAGTSISGGNAKKYANYARMGGVVLLVAATGLWALNIPGMQDMPQKPAPAPEPIEKPKAVSAQESMKVEPEQLTDAAYRLEIAWEKAEKPAAPEVGTEPEPEPPSAGPEWSYLGPIKEAGRSLAMVSVDGSQRILALGRMLGETKLVGIDDEKITLETRGARRDVSRSARIGPTVAWIRGMQTNTPVGNGGAVVAQGQAGQMSPEVLQRLRDRGIDPSQAQRMREMGANGRNRGQPGNGNGRGGQGGVGGPSLGALNAAGAMTAQPAVRQRGSDADSVRSETAN